MGDRWLQCALSLEEHNENCSLIFGRINRLGLAFADRGQTGGYSVPFLWKSTVRMVVGFLAGITDWVLLLLTGGRVAIVRNGL